MAKYTKTVKKKHHSNKKEKETKVLTPEEIEKIEQRKLEEARRKEENRIKAEKEEKAKKRRLLTDKIICAMPLTLCLLLLLSTIVNVSLVLVKQNNFKNYNDYTEYTLKYESSILKKSGSYYVYFYGEKCSHCNSIKKTVFTYMEDNNENGKMPTLYLFKVTGKEHFVSSDGDNLVGVENYLDLKLTGTPTLILVTDGVVKSAYQSASEIEELLK